MRMTFSLPLTSMRTFTSHHNGLIHLSDLVTFRKVWVEVVFAIKSRDAIDLGATPSPNWTAFSKTALLATGQYAGSPMSTKLAWLLGAAPNLCGTSGENFRVGFELCVDLETDIHLPAIGNRHDCSLGVRLCQSDTF